VTRIVRRTGRSLPEVVFRFALELGMIVLTGTSDAEHMRADLDCESVELDAEDVAVIERIA
jgi:diketogulonate reductase-like aldo/keto reductase